MSCFQLSDEFLFAGLHLSGSISPPLRLFPRFSSCLRRLSWRRGSACGADNLFLFISRLCPVPQGNERWKKQRERGGHAAVFLSCNAEDRSKWMTAPASKEPQLTKHAPTHKPHTCVPAVRAWRVKVSFLGGSENMLSKPLRVLISYCAVRRLIRSRKLSAELFSA